MNLNELLKGVDYDGGISKKIHINNIAYDSRKINKGGCFIAIKGHTRNGNHFIDSAIKNGARLIITDNNYYDFKIPAIKVKNSRKALSCISSNFYENPSKDMNVVGVTGTNGKTTVTFLITIIACGFEYFFNRKILYLKIGCFKYLLIINMFDFFGY